MEYPDSIQQVHDKSHSEIAYDRISLLSVLTNTYWVARIAFALEVIVSHAETLEDAKSVARDHLGLLTHPVDGLKAGIPEDIQSRWRLAAQKKEEREI